MSFKNYIREKSEDIFPTDEQIESVANDANEAFWKIAIESFENKLEKKDFNNEDFIKVLEPFKEMQKEAIKEWLKSNWPGLDDKGKRKEDEKVGDVKTSEIRGGDKSFEPPASNTNTTNTGGETKGF